MDSEECHESYHLTVSQNDHSLDQQLHFSDSLKLTLSESGSQSNAEDSETCLVDGHSIEIHLESDLTDSIISSHLTSQNPNGSISDSNPQMLYLLKSITEGDSDEGVTDLAIGNGSDSPQSSNSGRETIVVVTTVDDCPTEIEIQCPESVDEELEKTEEALADTTLESSAVHFVEPEKIKAQSKQVRPKRKAALNNKYVVAADVLKNSIKTTKTSPVKRKVSVEEPIVLQIKEEAEKDTEEAAVSCSDNNSSDDETTTNVRRCVVCLRHRKFTEDIFDSSKKIYYHIDVLIAHLKIAVNGNGNNSGLCPECMNHLQRWHIFSCAISKRHEIAKNSGELIIAEPIAYESIESRVYRNYKKMAKVKEVFLSATHAHYTRRVITEKDWDFFCDHLFHSNSVKSEKSRELERFITSKEKMSNIYCIKCQKIISNGKKGYAKHMEIEHQEHPVMYPCDICGVTFPEKDMTASTEDYYPHWISHFYFNKCDDCGKRFPTKRALGQHRHAVHKNRQVKCTKCGKVLANKMSLDLHLLRHLPDSEKKKYMIKCKICKRKIAQWNIKSHMATHNEDRPWKCDHCDATFKMKGALVSHRDVVHFNLKNHVCSICGEAFKSASSLRGHVRRHEGRKDYKCEVCLKEYYTYSALKGHKVVHQTARDFVCEICGKAFKKKKALEEHMTLHTGEKPHACHICGRKVRVKSNLYKHMKIHTKHTNVTHNEHRNAQPAASTSMIDSASIDALVNSSDTILLTNNGVTTNNMENRTQNLVHIINGNESMSSASSSMIQIKDSPFHNNITAGEFSIDHPSITSETGFLNATFHKDSDTVIHTITMQHQHQDLLNVAIPSGHFFNSSQYITTLETMQD